MSGDIHHRTFNNVSDGVSDKTNTEETLVIINQQCQQIEELKSKLDTVMTERDLLLCEVSRLKFELEIADLKRIHDDRIGMGKERNAQSFVSCGMNGTNGKEGEETRPDTVFPCHAWSQGLSKKGSIRSSSDIIKRSRIQNVYELSQDLLDKQIEMLERKYGGVKARNAALTIQRAFRHYTLLKKFAAITAMAKAEKRLSRRLVGFTEESSENHSHRLQLDGYLPPGPPSMPLRSMSMRERRHPSVVPNVPSPTTLLPRSHSGRCDLNFCCDVSHPFYYAPQNIYMELAKQEDGAPLHWNLHMREFLNSRIHQRWISHAEHDDSALHQWPPRSPDLTVCDFLVEESDMRQGDVMVTSTPSPNSENSYHPASQKYQGSGSTRRVPPEVPKRTSSISLRSLDHPSPAALTKTSDSGSLSSVQSSGSDSSNLALVPPPTTWTNKSQVSEMVRKRQYRVGLNLFNKKPERGIAYLVRQGFLENSPQSIARFLISRKGLSKQMIGEYLGNLQNSFNSAVLECFAQELDLSGMQVDVALRKFQTYFRMPGEAQKIERLMEVFSHRYCHCNRDVVARLRNMDTIFVLAFAIIMLNTDLHTPNIKPERRMKLDDFIKNLRGIDDCCDIDRDMLVGIYERVKANEFKPGSDHVTQVLKVQSTIVGKKPNMALPHRRLVCYCRLYEVPDVNKKERPGVHQREVFLFNDLLVITKILSKKKSSVTYTFRQSFSLQGLVVTLFQVPYYAYGIKLSQRVDNRTLIVFNARNDHDRCKFAEDMRESISEMDEMESLRIEAELERQKSNRGGRSSGPVENRDSGVADVEVCPCIQSPVNSKPPDTKPVTVDMMHSTQLKRSALSNSLLDIHDQFVGEKASCQRRGSVGSLDSGMSVSFQSTSASTVSRDSSPHCKGQPKHQQSFLGGLFAKRERKASRAEEFARATQV